MSNCAECGKQAAEGSSFCPECGSRLSNMQSSTDRSGITKREYDIFIGSNADKYLTKFNQFSMNGIDSFSVTWHWPAFFVPFFWLLYRKLYLWALFVFVLSAFPFFNIILMIVFGFTGNYIYYKHAKKKLLEINTAPFSSDSQKAANIARQGGTNNIAIILAPIFLLTFAGILAAIAIPQFVAFKNKAQCASVKSNLKNAYTASQTYFADHPEGKINTIDELEKYGFQKTSGLSIQMGGSTKNSLSMTAKHPECDKICSIDSTGRLTEEKIKP